MQKLIGKGGMARFYKGIDPNLNRVAAIKVIEPGIASNPEYSRRFRREAQAVAKLSHPNIVSIYQFGVADDIYYMAMAFIDGVDVEWLIKDYNREGRYISADDLLRILGQIASALGSSYSQSVIH